VTVIDTMAATPKKSAPAKPLGPGALDGKRYLESLRDGREVWLNGEKVKDVTTHPLLQGMAHELARLYDLQHAPGTREQMTFANDNGVRVSYSYLEPHSRDDILLRRRNAEIWSRESFGLMGRYPDFCAAIAVGFKDVGDELAKIDPAYARNAAWHHQYASENDLCLGHGLHDPNMDKTQRPEQDPDRCVRIVKEKDGGIVVRGARFVTLGPFSHEMQIAPTYMLNERETEFSLWFAVQANAPGLRILCREPFSGRSRYEHTASARFEEQDALVVMDDVFVPWERVFLARQPLLANRLFRSRVMAWAAHAGAIQQLAHLDMFAGVGHLLAKVGGIDQRPHMQQLMGELLTYKTVLEAVVRDAEANCVTTPTGRVAPGPLLHQRTFTTLVAERIGAIIEHIGSSALIFQPTEKDFAAPELRPLLDVYYRGRDTNAFDRTKLSKLAWELTGDSFGGRQQLYERLHSGDPNTLMAALYQRADHSRAVAMVNKLLGTNF
jgi:4-hydroxyphenylacetate 3-monooxygenase oxygenase component